MSWFSRLRNAVSPQSLDRDLHDEISDHVERRMAELREAGLTAQEARRQALLRFGNTTRVRERSRELRLSRGLENTLQDVRYAWRGMRKAPAFAITSILSLALAIGANTAIFSIVDAAMLRPLPVPQPSTLFTLAAPEVEQPGIEPTGEREAFSYPLYLRFRNASQGLARLALFSTVGSGQVEVQIPNADSPIEKANRQFVSGEAFDILRVPPTLGRVLSAEEDRIPSGHPVAVISHDYWTRRFGADPNVLGRGLFIGGKAYSIVGVARKGFFGIEPGKFVDVWLPATMYSKAAFGNPGWNWFRIVGRLS
jgi:hypothetical protein